MNKIMLDLNCGRGEFLVEAARRMIAAGSDTVLDRIYAADSSKLNLNITKKRLEHLAKAAGNQSVLEFANIIHYTTISELSTQIGDMKFDVIVGNPPYQDVNKNPLYYKFHNLAVKNLLKTNGIMSFITPDAMAVALETGIIKGCHTVELRKILTLNVSTEIKSSHFKDIGINNFCYYVIENSKKSADSYKIITSTGSFISKISPLKPLVDNPIVSNILTKCFEYDLNFYNGGWFTAGKSAVRSNNGSDSVALNIDQNGNLVTYKINYTKPHKLRNKPKVFITGFGNRAIVSYDHSLVCATEKNLYTVVTNNDTESENLVHLLDCSLKTFLTKVIKARGPYIDFLRHFRGVPLTKKWSDVDLYKHFNLTQDEIDYIENKNV